MKLANLSARRKAFIFRLAGTVMTLGLLAYLLEKEGWKDIFAVINQISGWRFGVAIVLMMISRIAVSLRWHVLLRSAGMKIPFRETMRLTFGGLFASNFLPTTIGGDVFRLAGAIQLKLDSAICTASLVADRLVGMAGMALVLPLSLPGLAELRNMMPNQSFNLSFLQGLLVIRSDWLGKLFRQFQNYVHDTVAILGYWLKHPRSLLYALFFSGLNMICLFSVIFLLLKGMNNPMPFWLIAGLWSLVYFITLIPISINGYGLQEVALTLIFVKGGGISPQASLSIAFLVRVLIMISSLPGALFLPGILSGDKI